MFELIFLGINEALDLFIAMDTSNKHNADSFKNLKMYAKGILDEYKIGTESRGALLTYDSMPQNVVDIDSRANGKDIKAIIDSLQYNGDNEPDLKAALTEIVRQLKKRQNSLNRNTPVNVLVLAKGNLTIFIFYLFYSIQLKS